MTFGQRVIALRNRNKMTRAQLARLLDMNQNTLRHYEMDEREAGADTAIKIANVFNCTVDYLIGNEPEPISPLQWELVRSTDGLSDDDIRTLIDLAHRLGVHKDSVKSVL
ncbi:MAG: helix-turn-helix transcriptional regulator [Lachnospiraceae bacterium]|nr:helix-turn-helix transcriptional regulator [Lachnospiraceae bacterium]